MATEARPPLHLWIIGGLATLWGAIDCYDYVMTRMHNTEYLAAMMPGVDPKTVLGWIDGFPIWAQIGWGLGVWGGLAGAILLLARRRWAVPVLAVSLIGAICSLGYQLLAAPPLAGAEGAMFNVMPLVIIAVAAALVIYAWAMRAKGVLR